MFWAPPAWLYEADLPGLVLGMFTRVRALFTFIRSSAGL